MYIDYAWVKQYLKGAPSLEDAARMLNETGLETEVDGEGLEIEYTVNRPDAMCHYGIARELAVKAGLDMVEPPVYAGEIGALDGWVIESDDADQCARYIGVLVENVAASPSPQWLVERLTAIEQTCHNFLVDLTNFLLWEFSHPSHAFDADRINGDRIRVRFGTEGERLTTLDGRDHAAEGLLCIADNERPIAFAGVMGGQNSEIHDGSTRLLLELADFRGATVRATGRACNIHSDARHRFERGVDLERMDRVIRRFLYLLLQEQPEARIIGIRDMNLRPEQAERKVVELRQARLDSFLGVAIPEAQVTDLLTRMDCRPERTDTGWRVQVPGFKVDVEREVDVIEEIIRFAGLDILPATLPNLGGTDLEDDPLRMGEDAIRELLRGAGGQETCTYSFLSEDWYRDFAGDAEPVRLRNPMSVNQAVMRRHLLPNMLDCVRRNLNRGVDDLLFFEVGHVFADGGEPHHLGVVFHESRNFEHWWRSAEAHPFYRIKGIFELISDHLGWDGLRVDEQVPAYLQKGEALGVYHGDQLIGGFGMLNQNLAKKWDFETPLAVLELDLSFLHGTELPTPSVAVLSTFPAMRYDVAFVLDRSHSYQGVQDFLLGLKPEHLVDLTLFDKYEGKNLGAGKRSLGFRFTFQSGERTLTGDEVNETMERVTSAVIQEFGAVIRT